MVNENDNMKEKQREQYRRRRRERREARVWILGECPPVPAHWTARTKLLAYSSFLDRFRYEPSVTIPSQ